MSNLTHLIQQSREKINYECFCTEKYLVHPVTSDCKYDKEKVADFMTEALTTAYTLGREEGVKELTDDITRIIGNHAGVGSTALSAAKNYMNMTRRILGYLKEKQDE
jgi:hypothetical protein